MAIKKQATEEVEERIVKVKAKVNLKYDKDVIKAGEEFSIRLSDVEAVENLVDVKSDIEKLKKAAEEEKAKNNSGSEE